MSLNRNSQTVWPRRPNGMRRRAVCGPDLMTWAQCAMMHTACSFASRIGIAVRTCNSSMEPTLAARPPIRGIESSRKRTLYRPA